MTQGVTSNLSSCPIEAEAWCVLLLLLLLNLRLIDSTKPIGLQQLPNHCISPCCPIPRFLSLYTSMSSWPRHDPNDTNSLLFFHSLWQEKPITRSFKQSPGQMVASRIWGWRVSPPWVDRRKAFLWIPLSTGNVCNSHLKMQCQGLGIASPWIDHRHQSACPPAGMVLIMRRKLNSPASGWSQENLHGGLTEMLSNSHAFRTSNGKLIWLLQKCGIKKELHNVFF